jgi:hypothetical protein
MLRRSPHCNKMRLQMTYSEKLVCSTDEAILGDSPIQFQSLQTLCCRKFFYCKFSVQLFDIQIKKTPFLSPSLSLLSYPFGLCEMSLLNFLREHFSEHSLSDHPCRVFWRWLSQSRFMESTLKAISQPIEILLMKLYWKKKYYVK